ncbi:MAG: CRISPR-associated endoribonuclease Cas6 [Thermoplasmata archaeon]|nr:CRISPR-associated endoribonuclease Cas6 [Thermoplasmata archaeon]
MRAKVTVEKINTVPLPYDHLYFLSAMLYSRLAESNITLANETHSHTGFKFYNFSQIIPNSNFSSTKNGINFRDGYFIISSPDTAFIRSYAEGLLQKPEFKLGDAKFILKKVEILKMPNFNGKRIRLKTLSPVYVKTKREVDGKLVEWDLYPSDGKFYVNVQKNLLERYEEFYNKKPENGYFEIAKIHWSKPKRVKIKDNYRRCSMMDFELAADSELVQFAYDAGLGEKTGVGFGCLEVV